MFCTGKNNLNGASRSLMFLQQLPGVGPATIQKKYLSAIMSGAGMEDIADLVLQQEKKVDRDIVLKTAAATDKRCEQLMKESDLSIVTIADAEYPAKLNALGNSRPVLLYVKGNFASLDTESVGVVGTRTPSRWAVAVEERLVRKVLEMGDYTIVSGLAEGCDTIAHTVALDAKARTAAVLPCGVNNIFPKENKELAREIAKNDGCLISEYYLDEPATKYTFVRRDTLIAALSNRIIAVQFGTKSGTMHTLEAAEKLGKRIGCYDSDNEGDFTGNKMMISSGRAEKILDTTDLKAFL